MFDTWSKTAESFGFERYDASVLEPSELYKSKGLENEEIVNEQTYTFIDRGEREVTLRPEMTPTVARMVAAKRRELRFPLRWYSIPNLFRYERPQRGRLREHWQLNCDIFGATEYTTDVEIITMAYQILIDFGATPEMFEILINDRKEMESLYQELGIVDKDVVTAITRLNDRKKKITNNEYQESLFEILKDRDLVAKVIVLVEDNSGQNQVLRGLNLIGINNVRIDRTIARGFDYYTGTIFELVDKHPENNRTMLGGGRYDNLTTMFGGEPISGIGFGMGDVTMRDFLETHKLLPNLAKGTAPLVSIIATDETMNLEAQKLAHIIRTRGIGVVSDTSNRKVGKKIADASEKSIVYTIIVGSDEISSGVFTLKNLSLGVDQTGNLENLLTYLITNS